METHPIYEEVDTVTRSLRQVVRSTFQSNYLREPEGHVYADMVDMTPFDEENILTFPTYYGEIFLVGGKTSRKLFRSVLSAPSSLRDAANTKEIDRLGNVPRLLDNLVTTTESLRGARYNIKRWNNRGGVLGSSFDVSETYEELNSFLDNALPPALTHIYLWAEDLPEPIQGFFNPDEPVSITEVLTTCNSLRSNEHEGVREHAMMMRGSAINQMLEWEHEHLKRYGNVPVIAAAITTTMMEHKTQKGRLTTVWQNYISDMVGVLHSDTTLAGLDEAKNTLMLLSQIYGGYEVTHAYGKAISHRDGSSVDALDYYLHQNEIKTRLKERGAFKNILLWAIGRKIHPHVPPQSLLEGMRAANTRRVFSDSELPEIIAVEGEPADFNEFMQLTKDDTENTIQISLRKLDLELPNKEMRRGFVQLTASELDNSVTGSIMITNRNKSVTRALPFMFTLGEDGEMQVELELIEGDDAIQTRELVKLVATRVLRVYQANNNSAEDIVPVEVTELASGTRQITKLSREEKQRQYELRKEQAAQSSKKRKRRRFMQRKVEVVEEPDPEPVVNLTDTDNIDAEITANYDNAEATIQYIKDKLDLYTQQANSRGGFMFGKKPEISRKLDFDIRQVTVRTHNNTVELRLYFVPEGDNGYRYVGIHHKKDKMDQDIYMASLIERLKSEQV